MAKLPDRNTVDTLVNVMNNGTAGGFVVGNVSSLYQKGENDSQQVTRTEALATTQSLLNLGLTLMNTGMSAISNAQNTGSLSHLTPQATSAISNKCYIHRFRKSKCCCCNVRGNDRFI